ncbi:MAG TPA: hypothetical protein VEA59_05935 [Patescibacteria group bacterium]|nr:hypothetical protein [Patescibacteria group bacterium]
MKTAKQRFAENWYFESIGNGLQSHGMQLVHEWQGSSPPQRYHVENSGTVRITSLLFHKPNMAFLVQFRLREELLSKSYASRDPYSQGWGVKFWTALNSNKIPPRKRLVYSFTESRTVEEVVTGWGDIRDLDELVIPNFPQRAGSSIFETGQIINFAAAYEMHTSHRGPARCERLVQAVTGFEVVLSSYFANRFPELFADFSHTAYFPTSGEDFWASFPNQFLTGIMQPGVEPRCI